MGDLPKTIGRYEVRRELGRGTMGVVYEAHDPSLARTVALKTVPAVPAGGAQDQQLFEKRFFAEARIAARLSHPGIVVIHDVGRDEESGVLFIALEHLRGTTLAEMVKDGRPLEWRGALRIAASVADALHYAHARKVVHLDVKPANVMVLANGQTKLMDFGIARIETARLRLTSGAEFFGTPLFMSPEQALGQTADARADVFSLGAVLYTLLTGRLAFEAETINAILTRVIGDAPEPPSGRAPGLPPAVDAVVARALAKSPAERYPSAGLLAEDLQDVRDGRDPRHARDWRAAPAPHATPPPAPSLASIEESEIEALLEPLEPYEPEAATPGAAASEASGGGPGEPTWLSAAAMPPTEVRDDRERQRRAARRARILKQTAAVAAVALIAVSLWRARPTTDGAARPMPVGGAARPAAEPSASRAPAGRSAQPHPLPAAAVVPARLLVDFEHPLRTGRLRVWVDEQLLLDEGLAGRVARKLIVKVRQGALQQELDLAPGRHDIRVQVLWDDNEKTQQIWGTFKEGETRRLEVRLGRLRKNLSVDWK